MDPAILHASVTKGGENFSAGERQALALARAVLHSSRRVVVMDEPTANVDAKTDALLQTMLRKVLYFHSS
jgi:ABC-type multidrug transport system fused ATPase/permease subunit